MVNRMGAASFLAACCIGVVLAPCGTAARSGGPGMRGAPPPAGHRPYAGPARVQPPASFQGATIRIQYNPHFPARAVGYGTALGWSGGGWYGTPYSPSNYVLIHDQPQYVPLPINQNAAPPSPPPVIQVIKYRPGCTAQTETVAWPDGKEHAIRMVRC